MNSFFRKLFGKANEPPKNPKRAEPMRPNGPQQTKFEPYQKGDVIGDKYEVRHIAGRGGFGIVYVAHDRQLQKLVSPEKRFPGTDQVARGDGFEASSRMS